MESCFYGSTLEGAGFTFANAADGLHDRELCLAPPVRAVCQKKDGNYPPLVFFASGPSKPTWLEQLNIAEITCVRITCLNMHLILRFRYIDYEAVNSTFQDVYFGMAVLPMCKSVPTGVKPNV